MKPVEAGTPNWKKNYKANTTLTRLHEEDPLCWTIRRHKGADSTVLGQRTVVWTLVPIRALLCGESETYLYFINIKKRVEALLHSESNLRVETDNTARVEGFRSRFILRPQAAKCAGSLLRPDLAECAKKGYCLKFPVFEPVTPLLSWYAIVVLSPQMLPVQPQTRSSPSICSPLAPWIMYPHKLPVGPSAGNQLKF